ncbi:efflux RND transporter periplasmic adaptor subunit [Chitinophaga pinensis]|uniref:Efflux transporter, RND family, MFP subunit n=1 Tax=Chitinophaga pinensis (strain ATCC 43595 / DSM 2588 / LMG 13176 / NBRC 15968 / NCIMB 11800 / UQM 2034) TaxID=485918 RepID=A0A979GRF6_CHIPD|nr:efflux RND transporter periplasmic adaptor subunit [Chitinophaga pinensis]ACU58461.1 efflux transporter, RND family, MFP subunit [Chitinophaga pinensis DSM 2588]
MKRKTLFWILGIIIVLIAIFALSNARKDDSIKVAVDKAEDKNIIEVVSASGKIYPETEVKVSSDVSGEIVDLPVLEGDSVKKGQVLARIYADVYGSVRDKATASLSQAQAQLANTAASLNAFKAKLEQSKAAYDRNKELLAQKVVSRSEFETAEATYRSALADYNAAAEQVNSNRYAVQSAKAGVTEANTNLQRTTIVASMDGVVSLLPVKKGERVVGTGQMSGTEIMRIADLNIMEVQVDVGENDIPRVKYNDTAIVEVDAYSDRKFKGIVTQIASSSKGAATASAATTSSAEQVTSYIVHIRILAESYADLIDPAHPKNFPFRPGMSASVDIQTRRKNNVLAVPINAVTTRDVVDSSKAVGAKKEDLAAAKESGKNQKEVVFVLQADKTVRQVIVTTGVQDDANIEILSGLKPGETIISAPYSAVSKDLEQGKKVNVVPKKELFEGTGK